LDAERFLAAAGDAATVDEALALWRGEPVENLPTAPLWSAEVARLLEHQRLARQLRAQAWIATGAAEQALPDLRALVTEDPIREEAWLLLVSALQAAGRRAEALSAYSSAPQPRGRARIEPGEPLRRLHRELLAEQEAPVPARSARLDADAAMVLSGLARLQLGAAPGWVATALLDRGTRTMSHLESARLVRRAAPDAAGQVRFHLPALVRLLAADLATDGSDRGLIRVLALIDAGQTPPVRCWRGRPAARSPAPRWPVPGATAPPAPGGWFTAERRRSRPPWRRRCGSIAPTSRGNWPTRWCRGVT
jgi:hypothetical protein